MLPCRVDNDDRAGLVLDGVRRIPFTFGGVESGMNVWIEEASGEAKFGEQIVPHLVCLLEGVGGVNTAVEDPP